MERVIGSALAGSLKRNRESFNARFAAANLAHRPIDGAEFQQHLAQIVDPSVAAVAREFAERTDAVVNALFDLSLDLFRQGLLGSKAKYPVIVDAWSNLLPRLSKLLARDPVRIAGSMTNALFNLARTPGARPGEWLASCAVDCTDAAQFLDFGAVLAWRCGLPQYRESALAKASALPAPLVARALGVPQGSASDALANVTVNPWSLRPGTRELKIVTRTGAFRGFGGHFLLPPRVDGLPGDLVVCNAAGSWRIHADLFNSLLVRCDSQPPPVPATQKTLYSANGEARIAPDGTLWWKGVEQRIPELAQSTGIAASSHTVAVTIPNSYRIFLLGLV